LVLVGMVGRKLRDGTTGRRDDPKRSWHDGCKVSIREEKRREETACECEWPRRLKKMNAGWIDDGTVCLTIKEHSTSLGGRHGHESGGEQEHHDATTPSPLLFIGGERTVSAVE